jgi:hypothetical protein
MLHKDILYISFTHLHQIKSIFSDILGIDGVEHFSLDLVNPEGEMIFFSGTPQHAYEICSRGLGQYDGIISPEYYTNFEFYWWHDAAHKAYANKIQDIREGRLGLRHGFMLVRKWNNFHLIYSFATKKSCPHFQSRVINNINAFLKMGDYAYSLMRETYALYSGPQEPPCIEKFYPFEGGKPPARFTTSYKEIIFPNQKIVTSPQHGDNLIYLNAYRKNNIYSG